MRLPLFTGLGIIIALSTTKDAPAQARNQTNSIETRNFARWRVQDKCIADATKAFPDHDTVSLEKRDGQIDQCLTANKLPPRAHLAPPVEPPAIVEPPKQEE